MITIFQMLVYILAGIFFAWLSVLSYFLFKTRQHYLNLTTRTKSVKIDEILDKLIEDDLRLNQETGNIKKQMVAIVEESKIHLRKIGLVRFNPFGRQSVDQSFVLALLNEKKNGIVINFIYTPEGVRVYAKKVKEGKAVEHKLSEEEQEAIERAEVTS